MLQTWTYLVCSLLTVTTAIEKDIAWRHYTGGTIEVNSIYNVKTCPLGGANCLLHRHGYVHFKEYNLTLTYSAGVANDQRYELHEQIVMLKIKAEDIVIFNFGLHFNAYAPSEVKSFEDMFASFVSIYNNTETIKPKLFWQETMPQHFTRKDASNGYYNKWEAATWCDPLKNITAAYESDWRNRITERYMSQVSVCMCMCVCVCFVATCVMHDESVCDQLAELYVADQYPNSADC